eukprot:m.312 g.312  ORF g.312 m.312 type:complete len:60 (-) comp402_c0_seq1:58-237(-)
MPKETVSTTTAAAVAVPLPTAVMRNRFIRNALPMLPQTQDCTYDDGQGGGVACCCCNVM